MPKERAKTKTYGADKSKEKGSPRDIREKRSPREQEKSKDRDQERGRQSRHKERGAPKGEIKKDTKQKEKHRETYTIDREIAKEVEEKLEGTETNISLIESEGVSRRQHGMIDWCQLFIYCETILVLLHVIVSVGINHIRSLSNWNAPLFIFKDEDIILRSCPVFLVTFV